MWWGRGRGRATNAGVTHGSRWARTIRHIPAAESVRYRPVALVDERASWTVTTTTRSSGSMKT